ncbi:threonine synthase [Eubacterium pyruvativorans]|uniref:Threonine synthase n=1 Tax=Eubacterium pyruvativorans TaxID=155865 RepID=A0A1I7IHG2_9FIRM|nr:threonine synthase [Eubacterium pyruvativorans]SFO41683.1 threonine synthase [Eubacterium pyruvativorans]SFU72335.1 threonine synthase [Eubacterium pyruvativorans]
MKFRSTRGYEREMTGAEAVIQGIAPDRGLFVPTEIPEMPFDIAEMQGKSYQEVAKAIIGLFFDDYTEEEMQRCIDGAYDGKFEAEEIVPVVKAGDAWFLELYHGKTAAFKDMALSILPYLLTTAMKKQQEDKKICILTATSGDTGKAALEGFADVEGTEIIVFFPNHGVSQIQQKQMTSQEGSNVHVFAIEGNFDDAQTGVKNIFQDESVHEALLKEGVKLSSANSINIGRLVPQIAYYVYSYIKLLEQGALKCGDPVNVVVPTGNFGNILAAYYAKRMGLPVKKLICASNRNNVLTDFLRTGVYDTNRAFYQTNSPSMDILVSSNLERLLYHLSGEDAGEIRRLMADLDEKGRYEVPDSIRAGLSAFSAGFADVEETDQTIGAMYRENHYLFDTHTAVAYKVYEDYRRSTGDETPTLIASTASAYKFASSVAESLGVPETDGFRAIDAVHEYTGVPVPRAMSGLEEKPVLHDQVIDRTEMKEAVLRALS